jgi:hypothetical protein
LPGGFFSSADVTALSFTFLGITGSLTDVKNDPGLGGGPVQLTGRLSSDGKSFSTFEFDGGFDPAISAQCGFACAFTIHVNSVDGPDNTSNFIDADMTAIDTLNIATYTPHFTAVTSAAPEPCTWAMLLIGLAGIGFVACRRKRPDAALWLPNRWDRLPRNRASQWVIFERDGYSLTALSLARLTRLARMGLTQRGCSPCWSR